MADIIYPLKPILKAYDVIPETTMYPMKSYHNSSSETKPPAGVPVPKSSNDGPISDLETQQVHLLNKLKNLSLELNKYMAKHGLKDDPTKQDEPKEKPESKDKSDNKKVDKKVDKKAEKKAAKTEARAANKVNQTNEPNKDQNVLKLVLPKKTAFVKYDPATTVTTIFDYNQQIPRNFRLELQVQVRDIKWLEGLVRLGSKRGIDIGSKAKGERSIVIKTAKSGVELSGDIFSTPIQGRVAVWKTIGSFLQIYDPLDGITALNVHKWLKLADDLLENRLPIEELTRELNRRLGPVDFLGCHGAVLLPDLILKPLIADKPSVASNVELWIGRVTSAQ